jgi:hypothetical protein
LRQPFCAGEEPAKECACAIGKASALPVSIEQLGARGARPDSCAIDNRDAEIKIGPERDLFLENRRPFFRIMLQDQPTGGRRPSAGFPRPIAAER